MLSGKGNENGEKTTIGLISTKKQLSTCSTLFCTFLCYCFARLQHETSKNFLVTRFMEMSYVFLFTFFSTVANFHPGGRQHFSFSHCRQKSSCCSSNKKCLLCFFSLALALFLVELRWHVVLLFSFSLSLSFSIFQICGHDKILI